MIVEYKITQSKVIIGQSFHWFLFLWCHSIIFTSQTSITASHLKKKIIEVQGGCQTMNGMTLQGTI